MKARVSNLHKTEAEWNNLSTPFKPEAGELVIYDPDENVPYARFKVGDANTLLPDLDFFINSAVSDILQKQRYPEILDGGHITGLLD